MPSGSDVIRGAKGLIHINQIIRMNPRQKRRVDARIKSDCAYYDKEERLCLRLDDSCAQMITRSQNCRYFREAVLPLD